MGLRSTFSLSHTPKVGLVLLLLAVASGQECPPASIAGSMTQMGTRYYYADGNTRDFDEAIAHCNGLQLSLASVDTPRKFVEAATFASE